LRTAAWGRAAPPPPAPAEPQQGDISDREFFENPPEVVRNLLRDGLAVSTGRAYESHMRRLDAAGLPRSARGLIMYLAQLEPGHCYRSITPMRSALKKYLLARGRTLSDLEEGVIKTAFNAYGRRTAPVCRLTPVYGSITKDIMLEYASRDEFYELMVHRANVVGVYFAWSFGLRSKDVKELKFRDVVRGADGKWRATISKYKNGPGGFDPTRTETHEADDTFKRSIDLWMADAAEEPCAPDDLLFPRWSPQFIRNRLRKLAVICGRDPTLKWTNHALRFGSARTALLEQDANAPLASRLDVVARRTGHASKTMALHYARSAADRNYLSRHRTVRSQIDIGARSLGESGQRRARDQ
jgi:integrase